MKFPATLALGAFTALSLFALPACDDKKDDAKADAKADAKKDEKKDEKADDKKAADGGAAAEKDADGDEEPDADEEGAAAGDESPATKIGVEVCDEYLDKYTACIEEFAPAATKEQLKDALSKTRESWVEIAAGAGKETLEMTCKASLEAVKKTSAGWGCKYE